MSRGFCDPVKIQRGDGAIRWQPQCNELRLWFHATFFFPLKWSIRRPTPYHRRRVFRSKVRAKRVGMREGRKYMNEVIEG